MKKALKEFEVLTTLRAFDKAADYLLEASESCNSDMVAKALGYHAAAIRKGDFFEKLSL